MAQSWEGQRAQMGKRLGEAVVGGGWRQLRDGGEERNGVGEAVEGL